MEKVLPNIARTSKFPREVLNQECYMKFSDFYKSAWAKQFAAPGAKRGPSTTGHRRTRSQASGDRESQSRGRTCSQRQIADPTPQEPHRSAGLAFRDTFWEQSYFLGRKQPRNRIHCTIIHFTQDYIAEICFTARCVETDPGKSWWAAAAFSQ